ncbi:MAG: 16S rRNA (cytosine(967)-C(5))-methyltransferase RsmB [Clostridia bacterium]|nr:16S rRNA (cytosine(967)-C(5))-methyltransferase RsmB [Clostridia bacterium]
MTARRLAFDVLMKMHSGAYSNISLDAALSRAKDMDAREAALAANLVYGVTERRITLDYQLEGLLDKPIGKLKAEVLTALRMGAYQIIFCDRIPDSAAVNESVELVKKSGCAFAAGLVNAVLRKVISRGLSLPDCIGTAYYMSIKYSCEKWIVQELKKEYGESAEKILMHSLETPPISIRVNTLKTDTDSLLKKLLAEEIEAEKSYISPSCLNIIKTGKAIEKLDSFKKGLFHVQDISCQLCVEALNPMPGETVLDLCAAPGGKSFTAAQIMKNKGVIKAFDIYPHKIDLIDAGAARLGTDIIMPCVNDASVFRPTLTGADRVLCDVPCSGFGIMARKPEIKYKSYEEVELLPALQLKILMNGARYLSSGGTLVYSTCTLRRAENEEVCEKFLSQSPDFKKKGEYVTLLPGTDGCDGFFYAVFEKVKTE